MKYYVQFLQLNAKKELSEALGSDGVFILDGRNNLLTMTCDAIMRYHHMSKIHPEYCGWEIKKGDRFSNSVTIKKWIHSGERTAHL